MQWGSPEQPKIPNEKLAVARSKTANTVAVLEKRTSEILQDLKPRKTKVGKEPTETDRQAFVQGYLNRLRRQSERFEKKGDPRRYPYVRGGEIVLYEEVEFDPEHSLFGSFSIDPLKPSDMIYLQNTHTALKGLKDLWNDGKLSSEQRINLENRMSHFLVSLLQTGGQTNGQV